MRLTSKALANDIASLVLSHINIPPKEATTIEEVVSGLQSLTKLDGAAMNCSSEITLNCSSVFLKCDIDKWNDHVALDHVRRVSEEFLIALTSFKVVQSVRYATFIFNCCPSIHTSLSI